MRIDLISNDARAQAAAQALDRHHTVRSGVLFDFADTPPDLLVLPIPITRDGIHLTGTPLTLEECKDRLLHAEKKPLVLGYGACPDPLRFADYRDLAENEMFVCENAELTAEGGMALLHDALREHGLSLRRTVAVILGYGRIARGMAKRLAANGAFVPIGARRGEAREAAKASGYLPFDTADRLFFSERGRLLFRDRPHILINTVPSSSVISLVEKLPNPLFSLELSGKNDVLAACRALPYPAIDGRALPTRCMPRAAGELLADAILQYHV